MTPNFGYLTSFLTSVAGLIRTLIPLLFAAAVLVFFYGLVSYIWQGTAEKKDDAKAYMIWSIVALVVMASVYGLIGVVQGIFGIGGGSPTIITPPNI